MTTATSAGLARSLPCSPMRDLSESIPQIWPSSYAQLTAASYAQLTAANMPRQQKSQPDVLRLAPLSVLVKTGRGRGIRTREGLPPTRFPSVRPRPLGESSAEKLTGREARTVQPPDGGTGRERCAE